MHWSCCIQTLWSSCRWHFRWRRYVGGCLGLCLLTFMLCISCLHCILLMSCMLHVQCLLCLPGVLCFELHITGVRWINYNLHCQNSRLHKVIALWTGCGLLHCTQMCSWSPGAAHIWVCHLFGAPCKCCISSHISCCCTDTPHASLQCLCGRPCAGGGAAS